MFKLVFPSLLCETWRFDKVLCRVARPVCSLDLRSLTFHSIRFKRLLQSTILIIVRPISSMVQCAFVPQSGFYAHSILKATHGEAVRPIGCVHGSIAANEVEAAGTGTTHRTTPKVAVGTHIKNQTWEAGARQGQF